MSETVDSSAGAGHRRWPYYVVGVVLGVAAVVTGVLLAATHPSSHSHRHGPVFVAVFASVMAIVVAAVMVWSLRRQLNRPEVRRLRGVSFSQRRAAMRAVNAGVALTDGQRSIAQAQADQLRAASARMRWALPVAAIAFLVLTVVDTAGLRWLWATIAAVELLSAAASVLLRRRQQRRFHSALVSSPTDTG